MNKRAVDLSLEELAALGATAARQAVAQAQERRLAVTGTVDFFDGDQAVSSLAQLLPSGTVTLVEDGAHHETPGGDLAAKPAGRTQSD